MANYIVSAFPSPTFEEAVSPQTATIAITAAIVAAEAMDVTDPVMVLPLPGVFAIANASKEVCEAVAAPAVPEEVQGHVAVPIETPNPVIELVQNGTLDPEDIQPAGMLAIEIPFQLLPPLLLSMGAYDALIRIAGLDAEDIENGRFFMVWPGFWHEIPNLVRNVLSDKGYSEQEIETALALVMPSNAAALAACLDLDEPLEPRTASAPVPAQTAPADTDRLATLRSKGGGSVETTAANLFNMLKGLGGSNDPSVN
jgi:hypothetical protein